ncbi:MAG: triphosphoribosyl-dephospho-CoA synthase, partial [Lachnospiraceae bacterium]|nr:triphosphoribosyl-dephospho-CoA synthase [Lachnospiraceae bacterium]
QKTHGITLYQNTGLRGIRGEAVTGYPSIRHLALPVYEEGKRNGYDSNRIRLQTLLSLMSTVEDSNIAARKDLNTLYSVQQWAKQFLKNGGAYQKNAIEKLQQMDTIFSRDNISAGGCADLLAVTIFLSDLKELAGV